MFETSPLHVARPDDFLSNEDIKLITLPKRFSRDVGVLESQLRSMLDSVINLRPINRRYVTMPGLKNVIGNGRNLTSKGVKNICYLNASFFFWAQSTQSLTRPTCFSKVIIHHSQSRIFLKIAWAAQKRKVLQQKLWLLEKVTRVSCIICVWFWWQCGLKTWRASCLKNITIDMIELSSTQL